MALSGFAKWSGRRKVAAVAALGVGLLMPIGCAPASQEVDVVSAIAASSPPDDDATGPTSRPRPELSKDIAGDDAPNAADAGPNSEDTARDTGTVTDVVDGDTIKVQGFGTIRIIGIDSPERGQCGYAEATSAMDNLVLGRTVTLMPGARDNEDRYGRLLRYVDIGDRDAGLHLIDRGLAIARYDSRDGYGKHTREDIYVAADDISGDRGQDLCGLPAAPPPQPAAVADNCDPSYPGACIPAYPPDLDCGQISERQFTVVGPDPHGFDADHDGIGCES